MYDKTIQKCDVIIMLFTQFPVTNCHTFSDHLSPLERDVLYGWPLGGAAQLVGSAEDGLMSSVIARETHVFRPLCPPIKIQKYDLRPRPHNFLLPVVDDTNYIPRTLLRWLIPNPWLTS